MNLSYVSVAFHGNQVSLRMIGYLAHSIICCYLCLCLKSAHSLIVCFFAGGDTYCVVADKINIKVKNLVAKDKYDVVKADWLIRCVEQKTFIPW